MPRSQTRRLPSRDASQALSSGESTTNVSLTITRTGKPGVSRTRGRFWSQSMSPQGRAPASSTRHRPMVKMTR